MVDYDVYLDSVKTSRLTEANAVLKSADLDQADDLEEVYAILIDGEISFLLDSRTKSDKIVARLNNKGSKHFRIERLWKLPEEDDSIEPASSCCGALWSPVYMEKGELLQYEEGN